MGKITLLLLFAVSGFAQCVTGVSTGVFHGAVILDNGTLHTWGGAMNDWGMLGQGNVSYIYEPTQAGNQTNWAKVFTGALTTFGIKTNGTLWGTGCNEQGDLGIGTYGPSNVSKVFVQVGTATNWKSGSGSSDHTVAVKTDGTLWAWGSNTYRQLGDGTTTSHYTPNQVGSETNWKDAVAIHHATIGVKTNGTLWGWGSNGAGAIGQFTGIGSSSVPLQIGTDTNWSAIASGAYSLHTLALKNDGRLYVFGGAWSSGVGALGLGPQITFMSFPVQIGTDSDWAKISAYFNTSFAIKTDGTLWGWGQNNLGQLGDGTTQDRNVPTQIGTDSDWVSVHAGYNHTVAQKADGSVYAWGQNSSGQLGIGTAPDSHVPVMVINSCSLHATEFSSSEFILSPNPASESFGFRAGNAAILTNVCVYDLSGRLVKMLAGFQSSDTTVDIHDLASGIYNVVATTASGTTSTHKLVKE
ncbi:MAG: T9SS type A sorting domain-containing protein [Flavobacterium sp.]|uniref:RCC1 domain-containing protein n=1 Tax=Flavobacterium sp. TaxID=239 RepID=UPI0012188753|nr:T9SS type A sorting domain-containing protein [Flavobacterium sp.]RZJ66627.1 MAG: T9SS type A sorting domain-containing protein [Flavobacterium sp.]